MKKPAWPLPPPSSRADAAWPEEGLDSAVHIFFDDTAGANLGSDPAYTLCLGLVAMFEKIALKHGA